MAIEQEKVQIEQMKEEQKIMLIDTSVMPPIQAGYFKYDCCKYSRCKYDLARHVIIIALTCYAMWHFLIILLKVS